jgi:redox-sensitive bicupin YhaK (pirin superfamily)
MANKIIHRAETRGFARHGWLNAAHSFSFANYFNRERMNFGALRVLNDDVIDPGMGFGTHPHDTMEIITIPLRGAIQHKDSTGTSGVIRAGDVQVMSAGTGIAHSEFNASKEEDLNLLQIWVFPNREGTPPRYQQAAFSEEGRQNRFQPVASGFGANSALEILQDAEISLADISSGSLVDYEVKAQGNGVYLFVIDGEIEVAGETLRKRDAIGLSDTKGFTVKAVNNARLVALDVPMKF